MNPSTMKSLISGLVRRMNMAREDASKVAREVKNIFRDQDEVEDALISKDCRTLFYALQDEGLMATRRLEIKQKGSSVRLRQYYWSLKEPEMREREEKENLYDGIPAEVWGRRPKD